MTPWTVVHQALLSLGFSRQEYWSGLPYPPPGDLPDPGIKPMLFCPHALAGGSFTTSTSWEAPRFALVFGNLKGDLFPFYYLYCLAEGLSREKALVSALQPPSLNPGMLLSCVHHRQHSGDRFGCYFLTRVHLQTLAAVRQPQVYT